MSFEEDYRAYLEDLNRLYRRAMEAPLIGTSKQTAEIKQHQFFTKTQKDKLKATAPELIRNYNNAKAILLISMLTDTQVSEIEQELASIENELESMRTNLLIVSDELETALTAIEANRSISEREIVNAIDSSLSVDEKVEALQKLSIENEPAVEAFMRYVDDKFGTQSNANFKAASKIKEKARRPEILRTKPWFGIEHIRDSYRFKTVLRDLSALPEIAKEMKKNGFKIVKIDTAKLLNPGLWGWRIVVFDLLMPNGQLVEYYLPVAELEKVKDDCHDLFAKWRDKDLEQLDPAAKMEFMQDQEKSDDTYQEAWEEYLDRTGQTEEQIEHLLEAVYEHLTRDQ